MALAPFKRIRPYISPADEARAWDRILAVAMVMSPEEREEYLEEPEPLPPPEVYARYWPWVYGMKELPPLAPGDIKEWGDYHICPECYGVERGLSEAEYAEIDYHYDELVQAMGTSRHQVLGHQNVRSGHWGHCSRWRRCWKY